MKKLIKQLIEQSLTALQQQSGLELEQQPEIQIDHVKDPRFGDFSCNIAMLLAKPAKQKPRDLATSLVNLLPETDFVDKTEVAGPGFINFYLNETAQHSIISDVLAAGAAYGSSTYGAGQKINFEFVSANPTGPLHVGHGRSVAYGAACANLLDKVGYDVHREYYVNDAGRQMDILATSIWLRYLESCGEKFAFPVNGYKGDYINDIAALLKQEHGDSLHRPSHEVFKDIPEDEPDGGDKEEHIDALIAKAQELLGDTGYLNVLNCGLDEILNDIRADLEEFGVVYQQWYSERSLFDTNKVSHCIEKLKAAGYTYEQDGNLWFRSTEFDDDKDRVLVRQNGKPTYFASDIAYHADKLERGAEQLIDVLGADHHGYVARVMASLQALGVDQNKLKILIVQFAILYRGKDKVQMSTRSGSFITLRELREEVGKDAARFFYVMRKSEQHLDFDLELAKSQSSDNPVYYIQYAHARICSVMRQLSEQNLTWDREQGLEQVQLLLEPQEKALVERLARYTEVVHTAAVNHEPHQLAHYLRNLANDFHTYYNAQQFLVDDAAVRNARLCLILATKQILANGLDLLGVSAPEEM